ncbi:hypothetical protein [Oryzicola mucosus]|uniref:Tat pathway signal sequence domain protein n=1 Tax=Oryzicola mucosus TaxID=2767425 RepID=A0A8J6U106_9HYPH|nr:hypothetical protein [Oryzicola mucosus]MBD0416396.1 hypothetical protein [Oryzicola mucosus]
MNLQATTFRLLTSAAVLSFALTGAVLAQETPAPAPAAAPAQASSASLSLELNAAQPSEKGCRFTFVVLNDLGTELTKAAFEIALFDEIGVVDRLTVLDFKELPAGKTKVTRFDLSGTDCSKISRVLVNGSTGCEGQRIDPLACMRSLKTGSKAGIPFGV